MTSLEQTRKLLEEIGPQLNVQGILEVAEDQWALVYEEQLIVEISHEADRKCLTFGVELGEPEPEQQLETYQSMLAYSALGDRTGGVRIALESPYGCLVQILDLFTEDLDGVTLATAIDNFVDTARTWRELLASGGISLSEIEETDEIGPEAGIRV